MVKWPNNSKFLHYLDRLAKGSLRSPFSRHSEAEGFGKCMGTLGGHKGPFVLLKKCYYFQRTLY